MITVAGKQVAVTYDEDIIAEGVFPPDSLVQENRLTAELDQPLLHA
jgi:hypothetical protein